MTKQRWIGRELLEVVSTEFRDRSLEYYVGELFNASAWHAEFRGQKYALESGVTTVNGKLAYPHTILKNGDRIE